MTQPSDFHERPTDPPPPCPPTDPALPEDDDPEECTTCEGSGARLVSMATPSAPAEYGPCHACEGTGRID